MPSEKNTHSGIVVHTVLTVRVADDIVVQIGLDLPALLLRVIGKYLAAVQALFLAGQNAVDDRRGKPLLRQNARGFDDRRRARTIVVGAGCVAGRVHHIADARVDVTGDEDDAIRIGRAALDRDDIHDLCRLRHALPRDRLGGRLDLQATAAVFGKSRKARLHPAPRCADAALVGFGVGQGMARAETDQLGDRRLQFVSADLVGDFAQTGRLARRRCLRRGCGDRGKAQ